MKIVIDLEEFWFDNEKDLIPELQKHVTNQVLSVIWKNVKEKVEKDVILVIDKMVEKQLYKKASLFIDEFLKTGHKEVSIHKNGGYVKQMVSVEEYIKHKLFEDSGWNNPNETVKKIAKQFGNEMKERYDLLFASQIVATLSENGLLKEDAKKMLLEKG